MCVKISNDTYNKTWEPKDKEQSGRREQIALKNGVKRINSFEHNPRIKFYYWSHQCYFLTKFKIP